ncbi:MAG: ComEA family DNA-binding protein [Longimicrobiales bacterium]
MGLTGDEVRALGLIALLLGLSAFARLRYSGPVVETTASAVSIDSLEAASALARAEADARARPLGHGERIDINRAGTIEIDRLPRVGPALARRIVDDRDAAGPFRGPADLTRVHGIGDVTARRLAPHLSFGAVAPAPTPAAPARTPLAPPTALAGVDLNTATPPELESLPGIGPALARRIVAHRDSIRRFGSIDQLLDVPGIGPVVLGRIRDRLRVIP